MNALVLERLAVLFALVGGGWMFGVLLRRGALGGTLRNAWRHHQVAERLGRLTTFVLIPALLFRTMARLDLQSLPVPLLTGYFVPASLWLLGAYVWARRRVVSDAGAPPAVPATQAVAATYGNAVQLGLPLSAAVFGETGLALHAALVALHGIVLLTAATVLVELDQARACPGQPLHRTVARTVRQTVLHPVVLPVLAGLAWNVSGAPPPGSWTSVPAQGADALLAGLGWAAMPLCLALIGVGLASFGVRGALRPAVTVAAAKLLLMPVWVGAVAAGVFGLRGLPLGVAVMMAALPVGNNALIFAQRYRVQQAEATLAIVISTAGFALSCALWLAILRHWGVGL